MHLYTMKEGRFKGKEGIHIYYHVWEAEHAAGSVVIAHGVGEHCKRYDNLINNLEGKGISIYALDHRGHGLSDGNRGHVDSFADYIYDLRILTSMVKKDNIGQPVILLGHSMGGLIAFSYALTYPQDIDALILSSAGLIPAFKVPGWKKTMAKMLSNLMPTLSMPSGLNAADLSHDKAVVEAYLADPLVHDRVSARWYMEFSRAGEECLRRVNELAMPLLIIHGKADKIVDWHGSQEVMDKASSQDKELHIFDDLFHETMNELEEQRQEVIFCVSEWIQRIIAVDNLQPTDISQRRN